MDFESGLPSLAPPPPLHWQVPLAVIFPLPLSPSFSIAQVQAAANKLSRAENVINASNVAEPDAERSAGKNYEERSLIRNGGVSGCLLAQEFRRGSLL